MTSKVVFLCAAVAAVQSTFLETGMVAPKLLNVEVVAPAIVKTASVVTVPKIVTTEKRIIGTGMLTAAPVPPAVINPSIIHGGLIGNGYMNKGYITGFMGKGYITNGYITNGLLGGIPMDVLSPYGLKGAGIIAAPAFAKAIY